MKFLRFIANFLFFLILPVFFFVSGYWATGHYFQFKKIPYPFEYFGIAVGGVFFFWMLGMEFFLKGFFKQRKENSKMNKILTTFLIGFLLAWPASSFAQDDMADPAPASMGVSEKLDKVLQELDEIKAELQIIKVRASMR